MGRVFLVIAILALSGCFWMSSPPDLNNKDQINKITVIWDQKNSDNTITRSAWTSKDRIKIAKAVQHLDIESWGSSTVLPEGHSTRIILSMQSGKIWEVVISMGSEKNLLKLFDRNDRGWSGWINWSEQFIAELSGMIESEKKITIDLMSEYRVSIRKGTLIKSVPMETREILNEFPGYPEIIWSKEKQRFIYAK